MKLTKLLTVSIIGSMLIAGSVYAHSGRTNSSGCHNDNVHGGYHCHNGGNKYSSPHPTVLTTYNPTTPTELKYSITESEREVIEKTITTLLNTIADLQAKRIQKHTEVLNEYSTLDSKCRGGSGDEKTTWEACDARDTLYDTISKLGLEKGYPSEYGYLQHWSKKEDVVWFGDLLDKLPDDLMKDWHGFTPLTKEEPKK